MKNPIENIARASKSSLNQTLIPPPTSVTKPKEQPPKNFVEDTAMPSWLTKDIKYKYYW